MHPSALQFAAAALGVVEVEGKDVIETGAFDVNGSARPYIESLGPATYTGTDMRAGPRVDVVCAAEDLPATFGTESFDVVASFEMLEHAQDWKAALDGMIRVLRPKGVLVLTARGPGFPVHGYPDDHWRFEVGAMLNILLFAGLKVDRCDPDTDPQSPGVFVKAYKPQGWRRPDGLHEKWDKIKVSKP